MTATRLWPRGVVLLRSRRGRLSLRIGLRSFSVGLAFLAAALLVSTYSLTIGESDLPLGDVADALLGRADDGVARIVLEWRLPRVLLAVVGGAALALSGAVFQTITRNPLGSPDVIGFNMGAYTGALVSMLVIGGGYLATVAGALVGGTLTGLVVYLLALRQGLQGYRLIIVGIGVSALLASLNAYLKITVSLEESLSASVWGAGSLATAAWTDVVPVLAVVAVLAPVLMFVNRDSGLLALGDDAAHGRGVDVERLRLVLLAVGVVLTAAVTAVAGPIAFIALVAPQLAVRLTRTPAIPLLPTAFLGASLLALGDLVARTVIAPAQLPVGVVTATIGGGYLVWLLVAQARKA
ncbi:FecCD family ABC transporter permease [Actinorugispora endophytica]|uniref:Iron complex transport system permease protein n=1 Tax=Actinorugispora endophytica TaxID=1605990 RepID=A0A4R6V5L4_9ACTN|nr:iron chelate uptake ABC transporter family permease subunit [Actinorugispora endophytica]TDQ54251.1 iron complex transport system permease protein [Actinorugispora endophytica]